MPRYNLDDIIEYPNDDETSRLLIDKELASDSSPEPAPTLINAELMPSNQVCMHAANWIRFRATMPHLTAANLIP